MNRAKHQLLKLLVYNQMIDARLQKLDRLMDAATRITSVPKEDGAAFGSGYHDKMADRMAEIADVSKTVNFYIDVRCDMLMDTMLMLSKMHKQRYRDALYMRYVEGLTFKQMQQALGYESLKGVKKLCDRALYAYEKIMVEEDASYPIISPDEDEEET